MVVLEPPATAVVRSPSVEIALTELQKLTDDAKRDQLLEERGHKLDPVVRKACENLSFGIVKKLIDSAELATPAQRIAAARPGSQLDQMAKAAGVKAGPPKRPHKNARGELVIPMMTPTEVRAYRASKQKAGAR